MDSEPEKCSSLPELAIHNNNQLHIEEEKKENEANKSFDALKKIDSKPKLPFPKKKKNKQIKVVNDMKNELLLIIHDQFKNMELKLFENINLEINRKIEEKIEEIKKPQEVIKKHILFKISKEASLLLSTSVNYDNYEKRNDEFEKKFKEISDKIESFNILQNQSFLIDQSHLEEERTKMEETCNIKFIKIKEFFARFADQLKIHLKNYDAKKKEYELKFETIEKDVSSLNYSSIHEKFRSEFLLRSEFERDLRQIKEESDVASIMQNEVQNMFSFNEIKLNSLNASVLELNNKFELTQVFQTELESEFKLMNNNIDDLFIKVKKIEMELDKNLNKKTIYRELKEKEVKIKVLMEDLENDISIYNNS